MVEARTFAAGFSNQAGEMLKKQKKKHSGGAPMESRMIENIPRVAQFIGTMHKLFC